jgi:hypothetical protein
LRTLSAWERERVRAGAAPALAAADQVKKKSAAAQPKARPGFGPPLGSASRAQKRTKSIYFRADAGFANPDVYEFLEAEQIRASLALPFDDSLLLAANALIWAWALIALAGRPALLGTALLAYVLGLRHAVDADYIASMLLSIVGNQVATGIDNARMHLSAIERSRQLEHISA